LAPVQKRERVLISASGYKRFICGSESMRRGATVESGNIISCQWQQRPESTSQNNVSSQRRTSRTRQSHRILEAKFRFKIDCLSAQSCHKRPTVIPTTDIVIR